MVMKSGEHWLCVNPACGCAVLVESNGGIEGQNPRCACGSIMKKGYSPPVLRYLDFLRFPESALANRDSSKDGPMRAGAIHHASGVRPTKSLAVRGGLVHTFGGLAGFLGVTFLCWGLYILKEAFANPLDAGAAALISGAFIFTLAAMLLFFLLKPRKRPRTASHDRAVDSAALAVRSHCYPVVGAAGPDQLHDDLAYQRFYVDYSRIRP